MNMNGLNFSYILPGVLAGMSLPGRINPLENDLIYLKERGVQAIVTLTEEALPGQSVLRAGFDYLHLPVEDFASPRMEQIQECMRFIERMRSGARAVAIHCYAGLGRTGTMLACFLVKQGIDARKAINQVRSVRPDSIQSEEQVRIVFSYAKSIEA